ncbi:MAG TPA: HAMP domain-containing sensor histidine kinase, partial [Candidatus Elarobacter sp.]|nr:HAMP domain-containing sensor histidine kinase [Candidatus Elarobacter sp.]
AASRNEPFVAAATEIETRLSRPGIRINAYGRSSRDPNHGSGHRATSVPLLIRRAPPRPSPAAQQPPLARAPASPLVPMVVDGRVTYVDPGTVHLEGSRLGFALGTALGAHLQRVDLDDGYVRVFPDPDATERVAFLLLVGIVLVGAIAGVLAWLAGRYITTQVLLPLVEVTHALQRFAARDFTPQPIAVAGKSEFDAIALAYNAAATQVASAFAERAQAETQMRQFVADAGHELRTPLTIVLGYIDLLRRKADAGDERSRRIFASISIEGARMRTLIDNLVLLAKMEGEDVRPAEPFDLRALIDEIVESRRLLYPGVTLDCSVTVDAHIVGDRSEIYEAIANVVDNAFKYAPGSPVRIVATAADGGVEVTVTDQGPGIHSDDREGIFDRFYRGATRGEVEGSGLGLAIAKRAVERAGGSLTIAASSPQGTTFSLRLRADQVRRQPFRPTATRAPA